MSMDGGEAYYQPPRFCIEVNVARGGRKLAVFRLNLGAIPDSTVEVTVNLHCLHCRPTVYFNQLFDDVNKCSFIKKG